MPLRRHIILTLLAALLAGSRLAAPPAAAQDHAFVPVGDWAYTYIERLQRRGHLLELNPTALPYTRGEIRNALGEVKRRKLSALEKTWFELLESEFCSDSRKRRRRGGADIQAGVAFSAGLRTINGERIDVLRPEATADPTLEIGALNLYPNASLRGYLERGRLIAHPGLRFDVYYRDDPDGLDAANRLITRSDESYIGYNGRFASLYLGRVARHWAAPAEPSLMLSDNAVGMDQIAFRVGGGRLTWQGLLGELDSATPDGRFTGTAGADSVGGSIRRFLAVHRVDWRPSKHVGLSVMEAALYSGPNAGPSIKFLNPLLIHLFSIDGRPKNDENNGLVAGLLWAQAGAWTLTGQLMMDDFDILGETSEPVSAAITGSLTYAGLSRADLRLSATAVSARAYNTHQPEGRYVYLNRGLATSLSDLIHINLRAPIFLDALTPGLTLTPKFDWLSQGERDFRQPYPDRTTGAILDGTVMRVVRPGLEVRFQRGRIWWLGIDLGSNFVSNAEHVEGLDRLRWTFLAEFGLRLRLDRRVDLSF